MQPLIRSDDIIEGCRTDECNILLVVPFHHSKSDVNSLYVT